MRVYCLKTLNKLSIYPLGNTPSAPSVPQSQDVSIQTNASENRVASGDLPSLDLLGRRQVTRDPQAIPLILRSSGLGWVTREMGATFIMGGVSYLPWLAGTLEEHLGEGYWLSFNQRLPISYEVGDWLYRLLH